MTRNNLIGFVLFLLIGVSCSETSPVEGTVEGLWGGEGIQIEVRGARTLFYLSCADGTVDGAIDLDREGRFAAVGSIAIGPVISEVVAATYEGQVVADILTVTITVVDSGLVLGTFTAQRDRNVQLVQCR